MKNVEDTFVLSWQQVKKTLYYELETTDYSYGNRRDRDIKVIQLVEKLEELGYSNKFKLGLCMLGIIISRSIDLNFDGSHHFMIVGISSGNSYHFGYLDETTDYLSRKYTVFETLDIINHPPFFEMLEKLLNQKIN